MRSRHILRFLVELGARFAFVGRQYWLEGRGDEFFIDLLFCYLRLRCHVVVELKSMLFKPEYGATALLPFRARRASQGTGRPANYRPASVQAENSAGGGLCAARPDETDPSYAPILCPGLQGSTPITAQSSRSCAVILFGIAVITGATRARNRDRS